MSTAEIDQLARLLAKLPGLGARSSRRAVLALLKRRETLGEPLVRALREAFDKVRACGVCGNLDSIDPCGICASQRRDRQTILVCEEVEDLWAMERAQSYGGLYHVLGGKLSAIDAVGPEDLGIDRLMARIQADDVKEVILALGATVDGQTTAHYIAERLAGLAVNVSRLGHGVPVGGELNYLDEGTLQAALRARQKLTL
ncbi:DNA replication and repair protein RecR [Arboricoccus pini]|uniref:Recombination protein RecR n=1 Tax=Arboricoccus pini TaxID=1963835 RepID=A0A212QXB3_9PROT|nr:recombination mediator RecR [Arboricoccus pini]SNB64349.1 DNA replication and repair protein RecR [Arboricoccus pini]